MILRICIFLKVHTWTRSEFLFWHFYEVEFSQRDRWYGVRSERLKSTCSNCELLLISLYLKILILWTVAKLSESENTFYLKQQQNAWMLSLGFGTTKNSTPPQSRRGHVSWTAASHSVLVSTCLANRTLCAHSDLPTWLQHMLCSFAKLQRLNS